MNIRHLFQLKSYEHVEMVIRCHPIFLLRNVLMLVVLAAVPAGVFLMLQNAVQNLLTNPVAMAIVGTLGSIYYLGIWLFFFSTVLDYYLDIWVLTNDRLIAVEQEGLFSRTISEMDLWLVQDVTSEIKGIGATIFSYGKLSVQTAGKEERFHFEDCHNPNAIRQKILALAEEDRKYHVGNVVMNQVGL